MQNQVEKPVCERIFGIDDPLNIVSNLENYTVIVAQKDEYGTLLNAAKFENGDFPKNPSANAVYYFWDNLRDMNPLCGKMIY